jgi:hypothetical protein
VKIIFLNHLTAGNEKSGYVSFSEDEIKTCRLIEEDPDNRTENVILTLAGVPKRVRVPARQIQILLSKHQPDFRVDMWLVGHGYQADYYVNGLPALTECRDFGGTHRVKRMVKWLLDNFQKLLAQMRKEH